MRARRSVIALAIGCSALVTSPAGATVSDADDYANQFTFTYNDCGFPVQVTVTVEGRAFFREGKGKHEGFFFVHDNFHYVETHRANGTFFTITGDAVFQETQATPVGDDLFESSSIEAGQPFVVRDADGDVVLRDRGSLQHTILFHTGGDDVPGGQVLDEDVEVHGPHPGFTDPTDFCALLA